MKAEEIETIIKNVANELGLELMQAGAYWRANSYAMDWNAFPWAWDAYIKLADGRLFRYGGKVTNQVAHLAGIDAIVREVLSKVANEQASGDSSISE